MNVAGHCIAGNFFATGSTTPAHLATGHPHCWRTRTVLALLNKDYPTGAWGGAPRGHHSPTPRNVSVCHHSLAQIAARMALIGRFGNRNSAEDSALVYPPYDTHRLGHRSKTAELALRGSFATPRSAGETTRSDSSGQRDTPSLGTRWRPQPCQQAHAAATQWARDECGSSISRHKARSGGFGTSARMNSRPCPPARNAGNGASKQFSSSHYRSRRLAAYPTLNPDIANDQLDSASLPHFASTRISFSTTLTGQGDRADQPPGSGSARHSFKDSDSSTSADHRTRQVRQEVFGWDMGTT